MGPQETIEQKLKRAGYFHRGSETIGTREILRVKPKGEVKVIASMNAFRASNFADRILRIRALKRPAQREASSDNTTEAVMSEQH